jgi:hypothetical protein
MAPLEIATFEVDATPGIGDPVNYGTVEAIDDPLSCRGVVLLPAGRPIVLAAIDWIGTYNGGYEAWRFALARAAGTSPERVSIHSVHQHEAPGFDHEAQTMLLSHGIEDEAVDQEFAWDTIHRAADAVREAIADPEPVTHAGAGTAEVDRVASNRQLLDTEGDLLHVRFSSEEEAKWRDAPEGLIDPTIRVLGFWNGDQPLAALSYYATHPQSYYRDRRVTCDFPGIARNDHEAETGVFQVHFTGAAGNVAAGKYNDGSHERRPELARRLREGMAAAWEDVDPSPVDAGDVSWKVSPVSLPPSPDLDRDELIEGVREEGDYWAARDLAWLQRCETGQSIDFTALSIDDTWVVHGPGELFVEYQLAAARMRPDCTVAMAAYGDGGPAYIGTRDAYPRGGYEVGDASKVAPEAEDAIVPALRELLDVPADATVTTPSEITREEKPRLDL